MTIKKSLLKNSATKLLCAATFLFVLCSFSTQNVLADDTSDNDESYYANPAQAAHAAQLADQAALEDDSVQQAWDSYQDALDALGEEPTEGELANVAALEEAYQDKLAEVTGVVSEDIAAMRTSGMGWGEIAHELGVHPSVLGLGHKKGQVDISTQEIEEATARNTKNGMAKGHGLGLHAAANSPSKGLGQTSAKGQSKAKSGNVSGAAGLGSSKGNSSSGKSSGGSKGGNNSNQGGNKNGGSHGSGGKGDKGNNGGGNGNGNGKK